MTAFIQELWHVGLYKRSQGRITRQVTFFALAACVFLGLWRLSETIRDAFPSTSTDTDLLAYNLLVYGLPAVLLLAGLWISYRVVNVPSFADFLIAVEAEMNKVSWPGRAELIRASVVVLFTIVAMGCLLAVFDWLWIKLFRDLLYIY